MRRVVVLAVVLALGIGYAGTANAVNEAGCKLTGGGTTASGDRLRAVAKVTKGEFTGKVKLVTSAGDRFRGVIAALQCRRNGGGGPGAPDANVNIADIEGFGTWNGVPGYEWAATLHDHGEGSLANRLADDFAITVLGAGSAAGQLVAGNVQIHPPNPAHP
jgi:hypothetical protein